MPALSQLKNPFMDHHTSGLPLFLSITSSVGPDLTFRCRCWAPGQQLSLRIILGCANVALTLDVLDLHQSTNC